MHLAMARRMNQARPEVIPARMMNQIKNQYTKLQNPVSLHFKLIQHHRHLRLRMLKQMNITVLLSIRM